MLIYVILLMIASSAHCKDTGQRFEDQLLTALDRGITHTLAYHYLWPFSQLVKAVAESDEEELLQIRSDEKIYEVNLNVRKFKPDELKVKVKDQYILVDGKHNEMFAQRPILSNHFMQRFALPAGCKPEEVTAVLNEKGILSISVPKHKLPPRERDIPIEVRLLITTEKSTEVEEAQETTDKIEIDEAKEKVQEEKEDNVTKKEIKVENEQIKTTESPLWQLMESTTHVGKIRKKELKSATKVVKENEVSKNGQVNNDLDYVIDTQAEE